MKINFFMYTKEKNMCMINILPIHVHNFQQEITENLNNPNVSFLYIYALLAESVVQNDKNQNPF